MRVLASPLLLVRRPGEAFLRQWPLALAGDVEGIHQARVATRRLREGLPLVARGPRAAEPARIRKALRHLTRALGPSRELDVSRLLLSGMVRRPYKDAVAAADRVLAQARADAGAALRQMGEAVDVAALVERAGELARDLDDPGGRAGCAHRAAARLHARAREVQKAVLAASLVYAPGPLHAVRISLKKFRYSFELAAQLGRVPHAASLHRLKALQDILGDMHDLQVLAACVRDAGAAVAARERPGLAALAEQLDEDIRGLHSRYVGERAVLVPVLARAVRLAQALAAWRSSDDPAPRRAGARRPRPAEVIR